MRAAKRYIVLPQYDHVSDKDVEEFADEINREFRPGIEAHVIKVDEHQTDLVAILERKE